MLGQREDIKDALRGHELSILNALGIKWSGRNLGHLRCPFPAHDDRHPSWRWDEEKAKFFCTCSQGSIIDVVIAMRGGDFAEASAWCREIAGMGNKSTTLSVGAKADFRHSKLGTPSKTWTYHGADGAAVGVAARYETPKGKQVIPWVPGKGAGWVPRGMPGPRPLYKLPELLASPDKPVLVTEGEKAADAAAALFPGYVVTTSAGGCKAWKQTDWGPLAGRKVTIWPDHDGEGRLYAENVAGALDATIALIVEPDDRLPDKWDLADPLPEGVRPDDLADMLADARFQQPSVPDKKPLVAGAIPLLSWSQIRITDTEEYLVKGILPAGGLTVIYGPPKCGKTFWLFDILMCVALGIPYRDRETQSGKIIYCLFEGQRGFAKRKEAYRQYHQLSDDAEEPPFYLVPVKLELVKDHPRLIAAIKEKCNGTPPKVIVLDTLNRSFTGSESSDEAMTAYVAACDAIREAFGCAVIIVHHSGLAEGRARGHTALLGSADAQIAVKHDAADNVVATVEFMKDGEDGEEIVSKLQPFNVAVPDSNETISSCVIVPVDGPAVAPERKLTANQQTMLAVLQKAGVSGLSTDDWNNRAREAGLGLKRKADFFDFRTALQKKGLIFNGEHGWYARL